MYSTVFCFVRFIQVQIFRIMSIVFCINGKTCINFHWTFGKITNRSLISHPWPIDWKTAEQSIATWLIRIWKMEINTIFFSQLNTFNNVFVWLARVIRIKNNISISNEIWFHACNKLIVVSHFTLRKSVGISIYTYDEMKKSHVTSGKSYTLQWVIERTRNKKDHLVYVILNIDMNLSRHLKSEKKTQSQKMKLSSSKIKSTNVWRLTFSSFAIMLGEINCVCIVFNIDACIAYLIDINWELWDEREKKSVINSVKWSSTRNDCVSCIF